MRGLVWGLWCWSWSWENQDQVGRRVMVVGFGGVLRGWRVGCGCEEREDWGWGELVLGGDVISPIDRLGDD